MQARIISMMVAGAFLSGWPGLAQQDTGRPAPAEGSPLKGRVRGAALLTQDGLKKIGESTKNIQQFSLQLIGEVSRKDTVVVRGPNVISGGIVIPAVPGPSGTVPFGDLPARKKLVDYLMNNLNYQVELLQNEIDALIIPEQKVASISKLWSRIRQEMAQVKTRHKKLQELTAAGRYQNAKIAEEASAIYQGAATVNKLRKQVLALVNER